MGLHSPSGLAAVPSLKWGSHVAQFFAHGDELRDLLVPYFKAGLENNERCLWVTGQAFSAGEARAALRQAVPDLDRRERDGQIEISDAAAWYSAQDKLKPAELVAGLVKREQDALAAGYAGLRTNGNCAWVSPAQWPDFLEYEKLVRQALQGRRMLCMCSYHHGQLADEARAAVMEQHDLVLAAPRADLADRKEAEEIQDLLIKELNHRVKNTLATVQAMISQTLRSATDLPTARATLNQRIMAMAQAHDLLTLQGWSGAPINEIVATALKPFSWAQIETDGVALEVSPRHTLALSLALHELATNATKYGALSCAEGRVRVQWKIEDGIFCFEWQEQGGPPVSAPTRQGFGSRLIRMLIQDLEGDTELVFDPAGLRCRFTARL